MNFSVRPPAVRQNTTRPAVRIVPPTGLISTAHGRLYCSGNIAHKLMALPGAAWNERRQACELSLTLETLRAIRSKLGIEKDQMAVLCAPAVLAWAKAAGRAETKVNELHTRIASGWRMELPWTDASGKNRAPFEHQRIMASAACALDGVAFLAEMGTGKTRAAMEAIRYKMEHDEIDVALVAAPRGALNTWEKESRVWIPNMTVVRLGGSVPSRIETLRRIVEQGTRNVIFLTNFEVIYKMREALLRAAASRRLGIIMDEMHKLANPEAQVTKAFMEITRTCAWRLGMTGTPIPNKVTGVWSQWYIIDLGLTFGANAVQFRREFFNENPYTWEVTPKSDTVLTEIGLRMRRRGLRFTKAECLDLPPKVYETVEVEMDPQQKRAYREMEETLVAELSDDEEATAATQLVVILRLTQITSGFVPNIEGKIFRFQKNPKLDALEELVREQLPHQQIIVWARYIPDIQAICERLKDLNPVQIIGGQNDETRLAAENDFQAGRARLAVAIPAAGGVSLNLQAASLAIYYSQDYSLVNRQQSEDRCHRSGSEIHDKVTYIDLVCAGTADEIVADAVLQKKELASLVTDLRRHIGLES